MIVPIIIYRHPDDCDCEQCDLEGRVALEFWTGWEGKLVLWLVWAFLLCELFFIGKCWLEGR